MLANGVSGNRRVFFFKVEGIIGYINANRMIWRKNFNNAV